MNVSLIASGPHNPATALCIRKESFTSGGKNCRVVPWVGRYSPEMGCAGYHDHHRFCFNHPKLKDRASWEADAIHRCGGTHSLSGLCNAPNAAINVAGVFIRMRMSRLVHRSGRR